MKFNCCLSCVFFSCCLCTKWSFPIHGRSIGHWTWCCIRGIARLHVLTSYNRFRSRLIFNVIVRRSFALQRLFVVRHTANRSQSRKPSKLWSAKVWSYQRVRNNAHEFIWICDFKPDFIHFTEPFQFIWIHWISSFELWAYSRDKAATEDVKWTLNMNISCKSNDSWIITCFDLKRIQRLYCINVLII